VNEIKHQRKHFISPEECILLLLSMIKSKNATRQETNKRKTETLELEKKMKHVGPALWM